MELVAKSSSLSSGELAQQKAELKLKHKVKFMASVVQGHYQLISIQEML